MDPSSDPGRDEYGLPPVDVQIPDDARDLERDIQAYHREQRARRRRARLHRLAGPLVRHGMVVPLVAVCLGLTLLSGTLLTVVAGRQGASPSAAALSPARSTPAAAPLPNAPVTLDGKQVPLRKLVPAVLAWVPQPCISCLTALKRLAGQAAKAKVRLYLVGTARAAAVGLPELASAAGQRSSQVLYDTTNAIERAYSPMGLTAIMARSDGTIGGVVRSLQIKDPRVTGPKVEAALPAPGSPSPAAGQGTPSVSPSQPTPQST